MADPDFTPPEGSFIPGPEDCVMPSVIDQKGRLSAGGTLFRTKETAKACNIELVWEYYNGTQYVPTTSILDVTVATAGTDPLPFYLPRVVLTITPPSSPTFVSTITQYRWEHTTLPIPPEIDPITTSWVSAIPGLRSALTSPTAFVDMPTTDDVTGNNPVVDPEYILSFSTSPTVYVIAVDNEFTVTEITDPSAVRTGPSSTLGFFAQSEASNTTGTMVPGQGKAKYDYANNVWVPF